MSKKKSFLTENRGRLETAIGHSFTDWGRVERALTHSSALNGREGNYERLEFLGDRVLGLCVAELLFRSYRAASEGELSVRLNQLVSAQTCAAVSDEMELHLFIRTGADVQKLTGKRMMNVRADVVESLIAAIYLDGGLEAARKFIQRYWEKRAIGSAELRRDAKTELQEWAHAKFAVTPSYRIDDRSGPDHDPRFTVTVEVQGVAPETGSDRSRRAAEQVAATRMLEREGVWQKQNSDK
ncbi:ribonuclease III [Allorhizobium borbori]|jgi:ribonuclease-3|uniref:Ribonuclease 3 n=1 Tax=Allorhizobium borbori TaxID=485907 RepID=A0A7W6P1C5_9HYPH|nr:ribonuclease III [Allorhizobium borbori]MBB4102624.1 ribonuclease-3 [Allorhizobium borbori]PZU22326.1 MAG: ribonuclease III [Shinella sp.]